MIFLARSGMLIQLWIVLRIISKTFHCASRVSK